MIQTTAHEITLVESATSTSVKLGKKFNARIIENDRWGSTAYYPKEVLERDGSRVFHAGLPIYKNHPTQSDEYERPERDVDDLIGKLTSDAKMGQDGLYADIEFYDSFLTSINEKKEDVGLSVRATGLTEDGEMDGRYGPVLVGLLKAQSVDVVTQAGAGGKIMELLESAREPAGTPITKEHDSMSDVTKEDIEKLGLDFKAAFESFASTLTESLAGIKPVEKTVEEVAPKTEPVSVDSAAILTAVAEAALPVAVVGTVYNDVAAGKSIEDAIKAQTDLRESFRTSEGETGVTVLEESKSEPHGLAYAVAKLNS